MIFSLIRSFESPPPLRTRVLFQTQIHGVQMFSTRLSADKPRVMDELLAELTLYNGGSVALGPAGPARRTRRFLALEEKT